jgi:hypothetical protein
VLTLLASLLILAAVVGGSVQWAVRAERRRISSEEAADARHH